jgi:hypothetical protein
MDADGADDPTQRLHNLVFQLAHRKTPRLWAIRGGAPAASGGG